MKLKAAPTNWPLFGPSRMIIARPTVLQRIYRVRMGFVIASVLVASALSLLIAAGCATGAYFTNIAEDEPLVPVPELDGTPVSYRIRDSLADAMLSCGKAVPNSVACTWYYPKSKRLVIEIWRGHMGTNVDRHERKHAGLDDGHVYGHQHGMMPARFAE